MPTERTLKDGFKIDWTLDGVRLRFRQRRRLAVIGVLVIAGLAANAGVVCVELARPSIVVQGLTDEQATACLESPPPADTLLLRHVPLEFLRPTLACKLLHQVEVSRPRASLASNMYAAERRLQGVLNRMRARASSAAGGLLPGSICLAGLALFIHRRPRSRELIVDAQGLRLDGQRLPEVQSTLQVDGVVLTHGWRRWTLRPVDPDVVPVLDRILEQRLAVQRGDLDDVPATLRGLRSSLEEVQR